MKKVMTIATKGIIKATKDDESQHCIGVKKESILHVVMHTAKLR